MRLLRLKDDGEISVAEFFGNSIPRYAVLSHTWASDDEEVTFKDLTEGTGKNKAGYKKIRFCGEQAAKDDLRFFWVDTCCIDKSSSSELSEAVNSMFRWYNKADKCYVFMTDVLVSSLTGTWKTAFRNSRWFTRGWTLQELLAPTSVEFFSAEGKHLGDRISLIQDIFETTAISVRALQGNPLSQFSVNERFSWAEHRNTKREEDAAYSLLGIFDIHMPLIYGEGKKKALIRLRKEIEGSLNDQPPSKSLPSLIIPFRRDDDFISRQSLHRARQICAKPAARAALVGLGGVGKSQIAIEFAYQVRDESPTTWVFWVHAGTQARFEEAYRRIAQMTKMEGWNNPKVDVLALVRNWLCDESNGRWVMIIDNADDPAVFFPPLGKAHSAAIEPLSDFLPQSPNGSILITSRSQDVARRLTGRADCLVDVKAMDEDEALALLRTKLSFNVNEDEATKLLQALDCMPLAITQAAAYIEQRAPRMTISRYLNEVSRSDKTRSSLLLKDVGDGRRDGRASNSIITTWQISFAHIQNEMPTAARLLSLMSLFDRQGIPESLLRDQYRRDIDIDAESIEADFEDDIYTLTNYSLVEMSADGSEFEMHRLVQFSMKKWLEFSDELESWKEVYITLMNDNYPVGRHENWTICQKLYPHAQAIIGYRPADPKVVEPWASVLFKAAWYAREMGKYKEAEGMNRSALGELETVLGAGHSATLASMNDLALVLRNQGKYEQADEMNRRALEGREKVLGKDHPDTLASVGNLGSVLQDQGKYEQAEELNRRALEGREKELGKEHPDTLTSVSNLASVLQDQGKFEQAEDMNRRALEGREKALGKEHPDTLSSVGNLALVMHDQGKYKPAEELNRRALEGREKVLGKDHPDTLTSVGNLGLVLQDQGNYEQAEDVNRRALEGMERVLGKDHPETLTSVGNLASVLHDQGKYEQAESMTRLALEGREKVLGKDHPDTLTNMSNLALVLRDQGKYEQAEEMNRRALEGGEKALGKEHPDTLTTLSNLALVLQDQGKYEQAIDMNRQALAGKEKALGKEHPDTLTSMGNLALVLQVQGKYDESEDMNRRELEGREKTLGKEHPDTLISMGNLALVLQLQKKYEQAEDMSRQVLEEREKVLGKEHPNTLTSLSNLALVLQNQGKYEQVEDMNRRALEGREKVLGKEHRDTLTSVGNLAWVLQSQKKYDEAEDMNRRALEGREKLLGPKHPETLISISNLAHFLHQRQQYEDALSLYQQAFDSYQETLGLDHPTTQACLAKCSLLEELLTSRTSGSESNGPIDG